MSRYHVTLSWLALSLYAALISSAQSPPPPAIVHIPLVTSGGDSLRYIAQVNMSSGDETQRFGFALSTTTGYTIVANTACSSCTSNNIPTYNASRSKTAKPIGSGQQQQVVAFAGGAVQGGSGTLSKEDCALHQANGSFWQYPNQTIVQANASVVFEEGISGLVGLGTNTAEFQDTVLGGWLSRNPAQHNVSFGLALNPPPGQNLIPAPGDAEDASASGGTLHMLQPDPRSFVGDIQWHPVQNSLPGTGGSTNSTGGGLPDTSWLIGMDGWTFASGTAKTSNSQGALASIEPFLADIFLPNAQAAQLYGALPGSQAIPSTVGAISQQYHIPCDADIAFSVILSGQEYVVPKEALIVQTTGGTCTGAVEGWVDDTITNFLLGSRFISTVYMVFQVSRPPSMEQQVGIAQRVSASSSKSKSHVGAIVGGVIGGVAFILIVGGALFWWIKRKQGNKSSLASTSRFDEKERMHSNASPGSPTVNQAYSVSPWTPSAGTRTSDGALSQTLITPSTYHAHGTTPTSATFSNTSPPVSAVVHENFFPTQLSPPGTAMSETFPTAQPPKVNQWVKDMRPTSGNPARGVSREKDGQGAS